MGTLGTKEQKKKKRSWRLCWTYRFDSPSQRSPAHLRHEPRNLYRLQEHGGFGILDLGVENDVIWPGRVDDGRPAYAYDIAVAPFECGFHALARTEATGDHEGHVGEVMADSLGKVKEEGLTVEGALRLLRLLLLLFLFPEHHLQWLVSFMLQDDSSIGAWQRKGHSTSGSS